MISFQTILQIQNGSKVIYRDNFAIIQGTIKGVTESENKYNAIDINYPKGFNKDNCIVISCSLKRTDAPDARGYTLGNVFLPDSKVCGSYPTKIELKNDVIQIQLRYIYIGNDGHVATKIDTDTNFKLILMKLPEISASEYKLGDVNGDGQITQADLTLVQNYIQGTQALTDKQLKAADVNKDGTINTGDTLLISKYINGSISSF